MKRFIALLLALLLCITAAGCVAENTDAETSGASTADTVAADQKTVGISLPEDASHWSEEGQNLRVGLEEMDCRVILEYAQNDPLLQAQQVETMVNQKADCLVVAAVDAFMLTDALQKAKDANIPVIAYDRQVMGSEAITCYVGFDHMSAGVQMGSYVVAKKNLEAAAAEGRSYTMELFMGAPEDHNALMLYQGVMSVLQPYFDSSVLVSKTGRTAFEDVCTTGWSAEEAMVDCQQYITEHYTEALPDILCAASDSLAQGCVDALDALEVVPGETWPLITGQGADLATAKRILSGHQAMSAYMDRQALVQNCLKAAKSAITLTPLQNGNASFYNGVKSFPGYLTCLVAVDAENCREVLVDSGVYTPEELK